MFKKPPFRCAEEGWGEFDMKITLTAMNKGGEHILDHDLNFAAEQYENTQKVVCSPSNFQDIPDQKSIGGPKDSDAH